MNRTDAAIRRVADLLKQQHIERIDAITASAHELGATVERGADPDFIADAERLIEAEIYTQAASSVVRRLVEKQR